MTSIRENNKTRIQHIVSGKIACSGRTACSFTKTELSLRIYFWSNLCSSKFLLGAGSERLYSKGFLPNTSKTSQDQKKTTPRALQAGLCSLQF